MAKGVSIRDKAPSFNASVVHPTTTLLLVIILNTKKRRKKVFDFFAALLFLFTCYGVILG